MGYDLGLGLVWWWYRCQGVLFWSSWGWQSSWGLHPWCSPCLPPPSNSPSLPLSLRFLRHSISPPLSLLLTRLCHAHLFRERVCDSAPPSLPPPHPLSLPRLHFVIYLSCGRLDDLQYYLKSLLSLSRPTVTKRTRFEGKQRESDWTYSFGSSVSNASKRSLSLSTHD